MLVMIKIFNETGMMSPGIRALVGCIYYFAAIWILYAGMTILHRISRTIVLLLTILVAEFIAMSILLMSIEGVVYETVMDTTVYWFLSLVLTRSCEV
ncbi:MAG: hypothetical protein Q4C52_12540, partial [Eubacteriales bacterium]|nr:hypothetical protein [Eubacteriales bacterium]